jgi:hypothetical protein
LGSLREWVLHAVRVDAHGDYASVTGEVDAVDHETDDVEH